ncbi:restriction endonuclease subunit S [Bisgaard Taxon 45]
MFKAYQEYKDSGVEWLGEIPKHWEKTKFKFVFKEKKSIQNMELPFGAISFGKVIFKEEKANLTNELKENYQEVLNGEFLINPLNLNYDLKSLRTALSKIDVVVSSGYIVLQKIKNCFNSNYLEYLLYLFDVKQMKSLGAGVRQTVNFKDIGNSISYIPPLPEQTQIAHYLEGETQKIDQLIAKQEKLIALLEEQRKSIISHAVTKGLNPNATMKDSGVEWLGDVPEHWVVKKLKYLFDFNKGLTITKDNLQENGVPCINYGEIHSKYGFEVDPKKDLLKCVDESFLKTDPKSILKFGDFIFADTSEDFEGSGNFTYLNSDTTAFAGYHTIILRLKSNDIHRFLAYAMESDFFRNQIRNQVKGIKVFSISQSLLKNLNIPLPNIEEQKNIINFLDKKTKNIKKIIQKQTALIEKLKEYRTSIIAHAVTGKIDVRKI